MFCESRQTNDFFPACTPSIDCLSLITLTASKLTTSTSYPSTPAHFLLHTLLFLVLVVQVGGEAVSTPYAEPHADAAPSEAGCPSPTAGEAEMLTSSSFDCHFADWTIQCRRGDGTPYSEGDGGAKHVADGSGG